MKKVSILLALLIIGVGSVLSLRSVSAHATPVHYAPDISESLTQAPQQVRIEFSERPELKLSVIRVIGPGGVSTNAGTVVADLHNPYALVAPIRSNGQGPYTVSWQVVSADDGHFSKGAFVFFVGPATDIASQSSEFSISHSASLVEASTLASELLGEAILLGVLVVMLFIWRPLRKRIGTLSSQDIRLFWRRVTLAVLIGLGFTLLGTMGFIGFKLWSLASQISGGFVDQLLLPFLATKAAIVTIYRAIGVLIFVGAFFIYKKRNELERLSRYLLLFLILIVVAYLRAYISHAATSEFYPGFSIFINAVHLLFKELWIGSLAAVIIVLNPLLRKYQRVDLLAFTSIRVSQIANISIAIAGATGAYIVWLHLKSFENIFTTTWGTGFVLLSFIAFLFVAIRMYHQLIVDRKLVAMSRGSAKLSKETLLQFGATFPLELALGILILSITSNLIITTPPLIGSSYAQKIKTQNATIQITQDRYERNILDIDFLGLPQGEISRVEVLASNPEQGIEDLVLTPSQRYENSYAISEDALQPSGDWHLSITAHRMKAYDIHGDFVINPEYAKAFDTHRHLDLFTVLSLFAVIVLPMFSFMLYRVSAHALTRLSGHSDGTSHDTVVYVKGTWILAVVVYLILLHVFGSSTHTAHSGFLQSRFQQWCAYNKDRWEENTAMRDGKITGDYVALGCTVGMPGHQYHFLNINEYLFYKLKK